MAALGVSSLETGTHAISHAGFSGHRRTQGARGRTRGLEKPGQRNARRNARRRTQTASPRVTERTAIRMWTLDDSARCNARRYARGRSLQRTAGDIRCAHPLEGVGGGIGSPSRPKGERS
jgi:hypothetical protein